MCSRGKAMPSGLCLSAKTILKNTSSRIAKAFKVNGKQSTDSFLYLIQVKAVLFAFISATSCYRFLGSAPSQSR